MFFFRPEFSVLHYSFAPKLILYWKRSQMKYNVATENGIKFAFHFKIYPGCLFIKMVKMYTKLALDICQISRIHNKNMPLCFLAVAQVR